MFVFVADETCPLFELLSDAVHDMDVVCMFTVIRIPDASLSLCSTTWGLLQMRIKARRLREKFHEIHVAWQATFLLGFKEQVGNIVNLSALGH